MADPNYAFGEAPVAASVHTAQRATPEELVDLARAMWLRVKASAVPAGDDAGNDALLEQLQAEFSDFNQSFPLVLRWMVQMRQFSARAFKKYLLQHAAAKLDTREAYLRLQVEYLVLLYRATHAHPDELYVRRYREALVEQLLAEDKAFMKLQEQVEADLAAQAKEIDADRRRRLYESLLARKVAREQVGAPPPPQSADSPGGA